MFAGATAGIAEHVAMYPVDTVKTRMQALAHPGQRLHGVPLHEAVAAIMHREGFLSLYRGIGAVALSAGYGDVFLRPTVNHAAERALVRAQTARASSCPLCQCQALQSGCMNA